MQDKRLRNLDSLPKIESVRRMILDGCFPSLIRKRLGVTKADVTAVRREIEKAREGKRIQHQPRYSSKD